MDEKPTEKPSLESLERHLEQLKNTQKQPPIPAKTTDAARVAIDFVSASAVGVLLGIGADHLLHSSPICTLIGLFLGVITGFSLLMRASAGNKQPPSTDDTKNNG